MKHTLSILATVMALAVPAGAQDLACPAYPAAVRTEIESSLDLDREFAQYSAAARRLHFTDVARGTRLADSGNFIDRLTYAKMAADGVLPAPPTTDSEFLRRVYLDLTGRIPTPEQAAAFLGSSAPGRRNALIEELLSSPAYADQLSQFLLNRFKVTRNHENITVRARDTFYKFVRDLFANDQPYDAWTRRLLTASGDVDTEPGTQLFARWQDVAGPIQDSWDDISEKITTSFLGYKVECVSCHNGRGHLEKINVHLAKRTRAEFWQMSAFLSRMNFVRVSTDAIGFSPKVFVVDRTSGGYSGAVPPNNPGCRPARANAVLTPALFTTGEQPTGGNWRSELARMVTSDRQFARVAANYLWSYLFGYGIVDPPDAWDLARVDPGNPPPGDWPMQNSNPQLLDAMAEFLVNNNFQLKSLIREIVSSETYQLSSRYDGQWKPAYVRYFARFQARRLTAEQMYDALNIATHTEQPMMLLGGRGAVLYANQLPDPTEPFSDGRVTNFLTQFGRGDWRTIDRVSNPTILGLLFMMNDSSNVFRTMGQSSAAVVLTNRVHEIDIAYPDDAAAIRRLFLATLSRYPTDAEQQLVMSRRSGPRYQWLSDLQWALVNKLDFAFNY